MSQPLIYENARVRTGDPQRPTARALRVAGGRVTHLSDAPHVPELEGRRIDLAGATVLPGLVDAHLHLQGVGAAARELDLRGASPEQLLAQVRDAAARSPEGTWIRGGGWDQRRWPGATVPSGALLDAAAPRHPVWLSRVDGHAAWANGRALALAGIDASTPDPPGGEIRRTDGRPDGLLVDKAAELAAAHLPPPDEAELRGDVLRALSRFTARGLTGVHDMGTEPRVLAVLRQLAAEGALTCRVTCYLHGDDEALGPLLAAGPSDEGLLRIVGVKLFADGALGSRGAALLEPYLDRPGHHGLLLEAPEVLARRALAAQRAGFQVAVHAIGDRGNRVALDVLETLRRAGPPRRHRVEHAQLVAPGDLPRFAALDAVASMQPTHATSDMAWVEASLGADRLRGAYAWRSLLRSGAVLALGSDAPVEPESPWRGLHAAVTRQDAGGWPAGGWRPEEALTAEEALAGFTVGPARAAGARDLGTLRVGAHADLTVVDRDPLTVAPAALLGVRVLRTVVAGQEVFVGDGGPASDPA